MIVSPLLASKPFFNWPLFTNNSQILNYTNLLSNNDGITRKIEKAFWENSNSLILHINEHMNNKLIRSIKLSIPFEDFKKLKEILPFQSPRKSTIQEAEENMELESIILSEMKQSVTKLYNALQKFEENDENSERTFGQNNYRNKDGKEEEKQSRSNSFDHLKFHNKKYIPQTTNSKRNEFLNDSYNPEDSINHTKGYTFKGLLTSKNKSVNSENEIKIPTQKRFTDSLNLPIKAIRTPSNELLTRKSNKEISIEESKKPNYYQNPKLSEFEEKRNSTSSIKEDLISKIGMKGLSRDFENIDSPRAELIENQKKESMEDQTNQNMDLKSPFLNDGQKHITPIRSSKIKTENLDIKENCHSARVTPNYKTIESNSQKNLMTSLSQRSLNLHQIFGKNSVSQIKTKKKFNLLFTSMRNKSVGNIVSNRTSPIRKSMQTENLPKSIYISMISASRKKSKASLNSSKSSAFQVSSEKEKYFTLRRSKDLEELSNSKDFNKLDFVNRLKNEKIKKYKY